MTNAIHLKREDVIVLTICEATDAAAATAIRNELPPFLHEKPWVRRGVLVAVWPDHGSVRDHRAGVVLDGAALAADAAIWLVRPASPANRLMSLVARRERALVAMAALLIGATFAIQESTGERLRRLERLDAEKRRRAPSKRAAARDGVFRGLAAAMKAVPASVHLKSIAIDGERGTATVAGRARDFAALSAFTVALAKETGVRDARPGRSFLTTAGNLSVVEFVVEMAVE